jgi:DNA-binding MarR family transcriptional regulator
MTATARIESTGCWDFVTAHGLALVEVRRNPDVTVRELALQLGLTERHVHRVLSDLADAGYLRRYRIGRRNRYELDQSRPMRHPSLANHRVSDLLAVFS